MIKKLISILTILALTATQGPLYAQDFLRTTSTKQTPGQIDEFKGAMHEEKNAPDKDIAWEDQDLEIPTGATKVKRVGKYLVSVDKSYAVTIRDLEKQENILFAKDATGGLRVTPTRAAFADSDGFLTVRELETGVDILKAFEAKGGFQLTSTHAAYRSRDGMLILIDFSADKVSAIQVDAKGGFQLRPTHLVFLNADKRLTVRELKTGKDVIKNVDARNNFQITPTHVAFRNKDNYLFVFDLRTGKEVMGEIEEFDAEGGFQLTPTHVALRDLNGGLSVFNLETGIYTEFDFDEDAITSTIVDAYGGFQLTPTHVAFVSKDGRLTVRELETDEDIIESEDAKTGFQITPTHAAFRDKNNQLTVRNLKTLRNLVEEIDASRGFALTLTHLAILGGSKNFNVFELQRCKAVLSWSREVKRFQLTPTHAAFWDSNEYPVVRGLKTSDDIYEISCAPDLSGSNAEVVVEGNCLDAKAAIGMSRAKKARKNKIAGAMHESAGMAQKTILVVDDNFSARQMYEEILETLGHKVVMAENGVEALQMIGAAKPDAVLTDNDFKDPRMNGLGLLKQLQGTGIPAIMVTGDSADTMRLALQVGAVEVVSKPFRIIAIDQAVNKALTGGSQIAGAMHEQSGAPKTGAILDPAMDFDTALGKITEVLRSGDTAAIQGLNSELLMYAGKKDAPDSGLVDFMEKALMAAFAAYDDFKRSRDMGSALNLNRFIHSLSSQHYKIADMRMDEGEIVLTVWLKMGDELTLKAGVPWKDIKDAVINHLVYLAKTRGKTGALVYASGLSAKEEVRQIARQLNDELRPLFDEIEGLIKDLSATSAKDTRAREKITKLDELLRKCFNYRDNKMMQQLSAKIKALGFEKGDSLAKDEQELLICAFTTIKHILSDKVGPAKMIMAEYVMFDDHDITQENAELVKKGFYVSRILLDYLADIPEVKKAEHQMTLDIPQDMAIAKYLAAGLFGLEKDDAKLHDQLALVYSPKTAQDPQILQLIADIANAVNGVEHAPELILFFDTQQQLDNIAEMLKGLDDGAKANILLRPYNTAAYLVEAKKKQGYNVKYFRDSGEAPLPWVENFILPGLADGLVSEEVEMKFKEELQRLIKA